LLPAALRAPANLRVAALGAGNAVLGDVAFSTSSAGDAVTFAATARVQGAEALVFVVTLAA
jgi:hypothetical protein